MNLAIEARQFLRSTHHAILSTFSVKFAGYPFGSVAPFVLDHRCQPIVLISDIAEHTKNIIANSKVSLIVFEKGDDLQANARLTLIGEAEKLDKNNADLMERYCRYLPESAGYFAMHDFNFYRIRIAQARYIAGFGKMGWLTGEEIAGEEVIGTEIDAQEFADQHNIIAALETGMIEHMNTDHQASMLAYCQHFYSVTPARVELIGIDSDGFDIEAVITKQPADKQPADDIKILRFQFESPIFDANSARAAFVALSQRVRAQTLRA